MIRNTILSLLAAAALAALPANLHAENAAAAPATQKAPQATTFDFTTTDGKKITITETPDGLKFPTLPGKNVITMFYIYSGTPCRKELQMFTNEILPKHSELAIVAFELKGLKPDQLKAFEKELGIKGIEMIDTAQAMPFADYIARRIRWQGSVPLLIVSNKNGTVKHMQLGAMDAKKTEEVLSKL